MEGASTNICYNLLDRNVYEKKLGDKVAFYWLVCLSRFFLGGTLDAQGVDQQRDTQSTVCYRLSLPVPLFFTSMSSSVILYLSFWFRCPLFLDQHWCNACVVATGIQAAFLILIGPPWSFYLRRCLLPSCCWL